MRTIGQFRNLVGVGPANPPVIFNQPQGFAMDQRAPMRRSVQPFMNDAIQQNLAFVTSQASFIEREVYETKYPTIQYPDLIPVDGSAPEWAPSVTFFSTDMVGEASWVDSYGSDIPNVELVRDKFKTTVEMAGIGYGYTLEEINQARQYGLQLESAKAKAANRKYEEFVDRVCMTGDTARGFKGLLNYTGVPAAQVAASGTGSSRLWTAKTADLIVADLDEALQDMYTVTKQVELADTLLLSDRKLSYLGLQLRTTGSSMTILEFYERNNLYTKRTGKPLMIRSVRGLETAGTGGTERMIAYRRSPDVLKLHLPMPHRFLPPFPKSAMYIEVPGIFRLGGLDIRLTGAVRYRDSF